MRKSLGVILCLSLLIGFFTTLHAQTEKELDQVALLKKLMGTWKAEIAPDTFLISEVTPMGKGFHQSMKIMTEDEVLYSGVGVTGFASEKKGIISVDLTEEGVINIQKGRFVSENKLLLEDFGDGQDHAVGLIEIVFTPESLVQSVKWRGNNLIWDVDWLEPITFKKVKK